MTIFQYISDIHLEFHDKHNKGKISPEMFVKPVAPYLILAGDIGIPELKSYSVFLEWCSQHWKEIFLVAGNHEYYTYKSPIKIDMHKKKTLIREICKDLPNVHFLDCGSYKIPDTNIRVLGCTLWSHIPESMMMQAITYMNDSRQILFQDDIPFTPIRMNEVHHSESAWLDKEIEECKKQNESCVVITHYLPSMSLIHEKYEGNALNCCFASESDHLFRSPVKVWFCGHTHTGMKRNIHDIPCLINPFGYPHERVETRDRTACWPHSTVACNEKEFDIEDFELV